MSQSRSRPPVYSAHPSQPAPQGYGDGYGREEAGYAAVPYPPPAYTAHAYQPVWEPEWTETAEADMWADETDIYYPDNAVAFREFRTSFEQSPHTRLLVVLLLVLLLVLIGGWMLLSRVLPPLAAIEGETVAQAAEVVAANPVVAAMPPQVQTAVAHTDGVIAPFFAPSVRYWEANILQWANQHGLDPNMVATVMQIESCGDPAAVSIAGAQGLFQVMPFHFERGEVMTDPDTNAYRGMKFLAELLVMFDGNPGLSLAGYNGGPGNARKAWEHWPNETQRYYRWGLGIYTEATAGHETSDTLNQWMQAGGASLCRQASRRLGLE